VLVLHVFEALLEEVSDSSTLTSRGSRLPRRRDTISSARAIGAYCACLSTSTSLAVGELVLRRFVEIRPELREDRELAILREVQADAAGYLAHALDWAARLPAIPESLRPPRGERPRRKARRGGISARRDRDDVSRNVADMSPPGSRRWAGRDGAAAFSGEAAPRVRGGASAGRRHRRIGLAPGACAEGGTGAIGDSMLG